MAARHRPLLPPDLDPIAWLGTLPDHLRREALALLGEAESEAIDHAWRHWAHDGQVAPAACADGTAWSTWVLVAGRGFGKTLAGVRWLLEQAGGGEPLSIALVGATREDARRIMVEGDSGLLTVGEPWIRRWEPSQGRITFVNGSRATIFSGASPDRLRGAEHHLAWCDELAKWARPRETWEMLAMTLRAGAHPRTLVTTTPRAGPVLRAIIAEPGTAVTRGRTAANPHSSPAWRARMTALYAGTRLGRQELDGELLPEAGALWTVELIEACRALPSARSAYVRTVIAVDPPSGEGTCGIIAVGRDADGIAHVLADHSVGGRSPEGWARAVADAAAAHGTDEVVAEVNQGGRMVKAVLIAADARLRVRPVRAAVGKSERAEPVATLFTAGKVRLHGHLPELEAQLLGLIAGGGYEGPGASPDRADAMVWGVLAVMATAAVGVRRL